MLYPIKFKSIYKEKIWGGEKLRRFFGKKDANSPKTGESWDISSVEGNVSIVANGFLKGKTLSEILEIFQADLLGEKNYRKFGTNFPLLIKFIDASDDLSVQVHPNDELAAERHQSYGKTEMWYVVQADIEAQLISGFKPGIDREKYTKAVVSNDILSILNKETVREGDVFFIPAGRVHAICKGICLAEIQQTSDITYRIFDYNRLGDKGKERELHLELAVDAINFESNGLAKTVYSKISGQSAQIISCPYFTANIIEFDTIFEKNYARLDSFVIYLCTSGCFTIKFPGSEDTFIATGETVLLPAEMTDIIFISEKKCTVLEIYIEE